MDSEIKALIEFIEARVPGNLLREIAKNRLKDALRIADFMTYPEHKGSNLIPVRLIHEATGKIFESTAEAAREMKVNRNTLIRDVNVGAHKYGFFKISQYSNQKQ